MGVLSLLFAGFLVSPAIEAVPASFISVSYSGKNFSLEKAPAEFPEENRGLLNSYQEYAASNPLVAVCEPNFPVVLISTGAQEENSRLFKEVRKLWALFESRIADKNWKPNAPLPLFVIKKTKQYSSFLDFLVKKNSYLSSWAPTAKALSGFYLYKPAVAVALDDRVGQEEYRLENNLLHQLTHLLLGFAFGPQPFWLLEGLTWHFEEEATGALYSFCYRKEFVYASEHSSWLDDAKKLYQKKEILGFEEICRGKKEQFEKRRALSGYALTKYLLAEKVEGLKAAMKDYSKEHAEKFASQPTQELDPSRQLEIFKIRIGPDFESAAENFLLSGPKKK